MASILVMVLLLSSFGTTDLFLEIDNNLLTNIPIGDLS